MKKNYNLNEIGGGSSGLDAFFASEPRIVTPVGQTKQAAAAPVRVKVASLQQLDGFIHTANDQLIHKSTNDLWALRKDGQDFYIERLFQDGSPVKG